MRSGGLLQRLNGLRRAIGAMAIFALLLVGTFIAAAPSHAGTMSAKAAPPCHQTQKNSPFDFCKERCLAASTDHALDIARAHAPSPGKVVFATAIPPAPPIPTQGGRAAPEGYYLSPSGFPATLKHQSLLI